MIMAHRKISFALVFLTTVLTIVLTITIDRTRSVHCGQETTLEKENSGNNSASNESAIKAETIPNRDEISYLRYSLECDGAWAEVDCKVHDRFGNPLPDAAVRFYFNVPEGMSKSKGIIEGKTDEAGRFFAKHKTTYACHWRIQKKGFYEARGILPFSNHFSWEQGTRNRWTADPLTLDVILDEKSGAKILHGFIGIMSLAIPTNTWTGFDFEANDLVEPYGKGINPHVSFYSVGTGKPKEARLAGIVWTNQLYIAAEGGGLSLLHQRENTNMPFCHEAPDTFQTETLEFFSTRSRQGMLENREMRKDDFIVFQTASLGESNRQQHFGIIRNLEYWPGGLRMEYFFNPVPGDRRTDADIHSKWDLKR